MSKEMRKMTTTVLFDLDGTLLPMVMDEFTGGYFKMLAENTAGMFSIEEKVLTIPSL